MLPRLIPLRKAIVNHGPSGVRIRPLLLAHIHTTRCSWAQANAKSNPGADGDPQSFFNAFVTSVKRQVSENKEMQQNLKQLGDGANALADSDAIKRAKDLGEKGSGTMSKVVNKVGDTLSDVAENEAVKRTVDVVSKGLDTAEELTEAVREALTSLIQRPVYLIPSIRPRSL